MGQPWARGLAAIALGLSSLACVINAGGPAAPGGPVPVSTEAYEQLKTDWETAVFQSAQTGQVVLTINETQFTSALAFRLESQTNPVLREPSVYLRDDEVEIFGITRRSIFRANALVVLSPLIDPDGALSLEVTSIKLGPVPAPEAVKASISLVLTEAFTGTLGPFATGIHVDAVDIADGVMIIIGSFR